MRLHCGSASGHYTREMTGHWQMTVIQQKKKTFTEHQGSVRMSASVGKPSSGTAIVEAAKLAMATQDHAEAHRILQSAIDEGIKLPSYGLLHLLASAEVIGDPSAIAAAQVLAVLANPHRSDLAQKLYADCLRAHGEAEALKLLGDMQRRSGEPLTAILVLVGRLKGRSFLEENFSDTLSQLKNDSRATDIANLWDLVARGQVATAEQRRALKSIPNTLGELYFLSRPNPPVWKSAKECEALDWQYRGFDISIIGKAMVELAGFEPVSGAGNPFAYQDIILKHRRLTVHDGNEIAAQCRTSFPYYDRVIFPFESQAPFYLITAGPSGALTGIYMPAINLIVSLRELFPMNFSQQSFFGDCWEMCKNHTLSPQSEVSPVDDVEVVALTSGVENFAHQIWNTLSGFERQVGLLSEGSAYDSIIWFGSEFFGPLKTIFPELAGSPEEKRPARGRSPEINANKPALAFTVGDLVIRQGMRRRLDRVLQQRHPSEQELALLSKLDAASGPVIWLGLRQGDKSWDGQDRHIPRMLDLIAEEFPDARFIIDGFSEPDGLDYVSSRWAVYIRSIEGLVDGVRRATKAETYSMIGLSMLGAISLARKADFYIAPIGTSQHKVGWFCDAPGVVYCSSAWKRLSGDRMPGASEVEGGTAPVFYYGDPIEGNNKRTVFDRRSNLENFAIDPVAFADFIVKQMRVAGPAFRRKDDLY